MCKQRLKTGQEEHSISPYSNKAYFKNMKLREKRKWSARKKMINIKYSTLWEYACWCKVFKWLKTEFMYFDWQDHKKKTHQMNLGFWETAHPPLP